MVFPADIRQQSHTISCARSSGLSQCWQTKRSRSIGDRSPAWWTARSVRSASQVSRYSTSIGSRWWASTKATIWSGVGDRQPAQRTVRT
jgi:hypothetical protein